MLKLKIGYPSRAEERQILDVMARHFRRATTTGRRAKAILHARQVNQ